MDGGRFSYLPSDFLRAYGNERRSALVEAGGKRWGKEGRPDDDEARGDRYYIRGEELWLARGARVPTTLYLDYHYLHRAWTASISIDFPLEARGLVVAEAAAAAKEESWFPGERDDEMRIDRALARAREDARDVARPTKQARALRKAPRYGNRW